MKKKMLALLHCIFSVLWVFQKKFPQQEIFPEKSQPFVGFQHRKFHFIFVNLIIFQLKTFSVYSSKIFQFFAIHSIFRSWCDEFVDREQEKTINFFFSLLSPIWIKHYSAKQTNIHIRMYFSAENSGFFSFRQSTVRKEFITRSMAVGRSVDLCMLYIQDSFFKSLLRI